MASQTDNDVNDEFWLQAHETKQTGWHMKEVNPKLVELRDTLFFKQQPLRVFVPLCGKTKDMKWFYDQGCHVFGVEIATLAIQQFFEENAIPFSVTGSGDDVVYASDDGRVKLFACNLYHFPQKTAEKFDIIWDRGSLVAINPGERKQYVELMASVAASNFRYLLETFEYDGSKYPGPPRTFSDEDLEELFASYFSLSCVSKERADLPLPPVIKESTLLRYTLLTPLKKAKC